MRRDFTLFKRKKKKGYIWYYAYWDGDKRLAKSTGKTTKLEAEIYARENMLKLIKPTGQKTLREYADKYFIWETCPHAKRLINEGKSITRNHVRIARLRMQKHLFSDKIVQKKLNDITRADIIDYRSRLIEKSSVSTANKVISILKTIIKEAYFREEINSDPTIGIGRMKYQPIQIDIFTPDELSLLFPRNNLGPWVNIQDYTCFLLAATTGMRRSEILALQWKHIDFQNSYISIERAWKSKDEIGPPKWNNKRTVPISDFVITQLLALKNFSLHCQPEDLVFCYDSGSRIGNTWWNKHFKKALEKSTINTEDRNLRPHSFRHTLNTLLRDAGEDPAKIRASLGWTNERTQDNYTHWSIEHLRKQAELINQVFK